MLADEHVAEPDAGLIGPRPRAFLLGGGVTPAALFVPEGDMGVIVTAGIPEMDDCKILTRLKAFLVDQGVPATLEHVIRKRDGNPHDLSRWLADGSESYSGVDFPAGTVKLRVREWLGTTLSPARNPIWDVYGDPVSPALGLVRADLPPAAVERAGIYELNWAVLDENGTPVAVDRGLLSVEKSMFAHDALTVARNQGPPTIQEIRMRLMDSSATENLLLDDVEFKDEQILQAVARPIELWNETPPPIKTFTTRDFPFRGAWMDGIVGQLYTTAAAHYRRNVMRQSVGGGADKDKEREYMAEGQRLWQGYQQWLMSKKVELNLKGFSGANPSPYASMGGW